jgi:hypothetical protein
MLLSAAILAVASLVDGFMSPPVRARPHVWWHWINGNVTPDGIVRDLDALEQYGFGGAAIIDIGGGAPQGPVEFGTQRWFDTLAFAVAEARRRKLEICLPNCSGWSSSGGPWVAASNAMKKVVWTELRLNGPQTFEGTLERPADEFGFYADIATVACSEDGRSEVLKSGPGGRISWTVPAGVWTVFRFGYVANGRRNVAASKSGRGYECDKFSSRAVSMHFEAYIGKVVGMLKGRGLFAPDSSTGVTTILVDSYEVGDQDWTDGFAGEFARRRGYDPFPFLPVLAGRTVGDAAKTKKAYTDFRQTCEELFTENYGGTMAAKCHALGLKLQLEAYGREMPGVARRFKPAYQDLADLPTTEFWARETSSNHFNRTRNVVQAARRRGANIIAAEAFTAWPRQDRWSLLPFDLKAGGDLAFRAGVNRLCLHTFVHQPWGDRIRPGMAMDQFGTHFDRNSTWWPMAKEWVTYLSRCQFLLQEGVALPETRQDSPHRRYADGTEGFFVATTNAAAAVVRTVFPVSGRRAELWDPSTGARTFARTRPATGGDGTEVEIPFDPCGSMFVMFPPSPSAGCLEPLRESVVLSQTLQMPWKLTMDGKTTILDALTDWTMSEDPDVRHFSGTATYETGIAFPPGAHMGDRIVIDLGEVKGLAQVEVDGRAFPALWKPPYRADVTTAFAAAQEKRRTLRVHVANTWANRLIGDELAYGDADVSWRGQRLRTIPEWVKRNEPAPSGRRTFATFRHWTKDDAPIPSGMIGPVTIEVRRTENPKEETTL